MARRLFTYLSCFFLACGAFAGAGAAELGEAKVGSHIGQQVVADLELSALEDPSSVVQARLASIDVYRGASLDMPPVLASLNMNVMRHDGRQFLHITSLKPMQADHLHLFVELNDGGRRTVRLATLWFTPDPAPPAPASTEPAPPPLAWTVAKTAQAAPLRIARAPVAPACPRQQPAQPDPVCAALDGKSALLQAQIVKLEEKVKRLQAVAQARAETASKPAPAVARPVAAQPVSVAPAKPRAALRKVDPLPVKTPAVAAPPALPWGWIGAGGAAVFALVGAVQVWRRQRERRAMYAILKKRAADAIPAEPTLG
jgi:pilus assembly protein FimV